MEGTTGEYTSAYKAVYGKMKWNSYFTLNALVFYHNGDMTEDCIGMVIAIFVYYFSINKNATQILYYTADK